MSATSIEFIPLPLPSNHDSSAHSDGRVTVLSGESAAHPFRPLYTKNPAPAATATGPSAVACEPQVTLQREDGRVASIRVRCSCGQVMELACVYPDVDGSQRG